MAVIEVHSTRWKNIMIPLPQRLVFVSQVKTQELLDSKVLD